MPESRHSLMSYFDPQRLFAALLSAVGFGLNPASCEATADVAGDRGKRHEKNGRPQPPID